MTNTTVDNLMQATREVLSIKQLFGRCIKRFSKRIFKQCGAAVLAVALVSSGLSGCSPGGAAGAAGGQGDVSGQGEVGGAGGTGGAGTSGADRKLSIVCTVFPHYDWTRQLLGDRLSEVELTLLLKNRIDLHNYQPSVGDMVTISGCDLFIYIGGESDQWVTGALAEAKNQNMIKINLIEELGAGVKIEEIAEGMEAEDDDDGDGDGDRDDRDGDHADHNGDAGGHSDSGDYGDGDRTDHKDGDFDEHIWLSLHNAEKLCAVIAGALALLDGGAADMYEANRLAYTEELRRLDAGYRKVVDGSPVKALCFADRFPFRYLVDDYGLEYSAAFPGCSAETEASFATIVFLSDKIDELGLSKVMVTESADQSIAKAVINNTAAKNQQILTLDAMQSVIESEAIGAGGAVTYLSIMESNLEVLKEALS